MISLDHVTKTYQLRSGHTKTIVNNLSMRLPRKNLAILGRNGMGKSTFLRLLSGVEDPDEGRVRRHVSVSWPIGFKGSFHRELSGVENVRFVARIYGQDTEDTIEFVQDFAELGPFFYEPVKTYSSGMSARLAFGMSMAMKFDVYLIDELMSVGDARFRAKSEEAFNGLLADSNLIMVSHSMDSLRKHCEAGMVLNNGTITYCDDVKDAIRLYKDLNKRPK